MLITVSSVSDHCLQVIFSNTYFPGRFQGWKLFQAVWMVNFSPFFAAILQYLTDC